MAIIELTTTRVQQIATAAAEVHKIYRFNVGAGPLISWIDQPDYTVRSRNQLDDDGQVLLNDQGQALTELILVESGREQREISSALFVTYYIKKWGLLDLFPGEEAFKPIWGIAFGLGLEKPEENLFAGFSYQPTLGIQIVAGAHYGQLRVPEAGITPGETVLAPGIMEPPIREKSKLEPFLSVVFDAAVFKRLLRGST